MTGRDDRSTDQRGAVVVVAVALVAVLVLVAAVCTGCVAIVLAHRRAQVAADLASLAGAVALQQGGDPCPAAARIAGRHLASLVSCAVEGRSVLVATSIRITVPLAGGFVTARARAGPTAATG